MCKSKFEEYKCLFLIKILLSFYNVQIMLDPGKGCTLILILLRFIIKHEFENLIKAEKLKYSCLLLGPSRKSTELRSSWKLLFRIAIRVRKKICYSVFLTKEERRKFRWESRKSSPPFSRKRISSDNSVNDLQIFAAQGMSSLAKISNRFSPKQTLSDNLQIFQLN